MCHSGKGVVIVSNLSPVMVAATPFSLNATMTCSSPPSMSRVPPPATHMVDGPSRTVTLSMIAAALLLIAAVIQPLS